MSQVKLDQIIAPDKTSSEQKAEESTALVTVDTSNLNAESLAILNEIIAVETTNTSKTKDLTYLFNQNQNKKTMVRLDSLNSLQDQLVGLLSKRVTERPDEISNQEVMQALKIVQDIMDRSTKNIMGANEQAPLIQINQQDNSVNMGTSTAGLNRESRDKVKNAVMSLLSNITDATTRPTEDIVDITPDEEVEELQDDEEDD